MDKVVKSRNDNGYIIHNLEGGKTYSYAGVRGGVAWPVGSQPAYLCLFGQLYQERPMWRDTVKGPIRMIAEVEVDSFRPITDLYMYMLDYCKLMWAEEWFCKMPYQDPANDAYFNGFQEFMNDYGWERPYPFLQEAPYWDNFLYGFQLAHAWDKQALVSVPDDSLLYRQITSVQARDLDDKPEDKFNAINGYRYVLGSFQRCPPIAAKFQGGGALKPEIPQFFYRT